MKFEFLDKVGAGGAIVAAAACPVCFPLLAVTGSAVGLGVLAPVEGALIYVFQGLVLLALVGNIVAYFSHKRLFLLGFGITSAITVLVGIYTSEILSYIGLLGLVCAAVWNQIEKRKCRTC